MRRDAEIALNGLSPASPVSGDDAPHRGRRPICSRETSTGPTRSSPTRVDATTAPASSPSFPSCSRRAASSPSSAIDWDEAEAFAERALAIMRDGHFDDYWTSALVYAWMARVALHRGDVVRGREHVARAARLRRLLTYALPVVSVQALLEMARGVRRARRSRWRPCRPQADQRHTPAAAPPRGPAAAGRGATAKLDTIRGGPPGASSLTTAELRLLPAPPDPPHIPGDRRPPVRLPAHGEDAGDLRLPQARRLVPQRSDHAHARARSPGTRVAQPSNEVRGPS